MADEIQNPDDLIVVWTSSNDVPSQLNNFVDYLMKFNSNQAALNYIKNNLKVNGKFFLY
jgi:hypothetical protein